MAQMRIIRDIDPEKALMRFTKEEILMRMTPVLSPYPVIESDDLVTIFYRGTEDSICVHFVIVESENELLCVTKRLLSEFDIEMTETVITELLNCMDYELTELTPECFTERPIYALSGKNGNGAAAIFNAYAMDELSDRFSEKLYVIPSSVHEVLLLPESSVEGLDEQECEELIRVGLRAVDSECVSEYDFLSDKMYLLDPATFSFSRAS